MWQVNLSNERIGEVRTNRNGSKMQVIEYNNSLDIVVKFLEKGNAVHTNWDAFKKGKVRDVYEKSVIGIGYIGDGEYKTHINNKATPQYAIWHAMMNRCYNQEFHERQPTYKDCTVAEEWHNYQVFAKWYDDSYYEIDQEIMCLDKDILIKGNKIYSPETCMFVPQIINNLFIKSNASRGNLPLGIRSRGRKFEARCSNGVGKAMELGSYDTIEQAFSVYKTFKEELIKQFSEEYKDKIPNKLYKALTVYEVEITD